LVDAVARCTKKEPAERFATAEALIEALDAAQLAAPEVPYALRRFAREVGTVHIPILVCLAICVALWYYITKVLNWSLLDAMFSQSLFVAVAVARVWHTRSEWQRLQSDGYSGAAMLRGFRAIVDEQQESRANLRAQPAVVARRKRVLLTAIGAFVASFGIESLARASRTQIGPNQWHIAPVGVALFFLASAMKGASLVAIASSPLQMPIGERLFRWFWVGVPGAWLLGGGTTSGAVGRTVPPTGDSGSAPAIATHGAAVATTVASTTATRQVDERAITDITPRESAPAVTIEARVAELERWRAIEEMRRRATG
jgi:hypothetical protein